MSFSDNYIYIQPTAQSKDPPQGSLGRKLNGFDEND